MNEHAVAIAERQANDPRPVTPIGIVTRTLQRSLATAEAGSAIDNELIGELERATQIAAGLGHYVAACTSPESDVLADLATATASENWEGQFDAGQTRVPLEREMLSGHVEGQFLKLLVASLQSKRVLEIGMFTGYSALAMAEGLPDDGHIVACELDPYTARFAQRQFDRSRHGKKIQIEVGPAGETLKRLAGKDERFDFVFIDADKSGYREYYRQLFDLHLLAPNALICVDNTLLQGEPYIDGETSRNGKAVADFNQTVAGDPRVEQVLVPLRDGITLIRLLDGHARTGAQT